MFRKVLVLTLLLLLVSVSFCAESLQETLESLSGIAAGKYVNPMVTSFGSDMNGGWFHRVPVANDFSWDLEFGFVMMGTMFTSKDKEFNVNGLFSFTKEQAKSLASGYENELFYDALVEQIVSQQFDVNISGPTITGPSYDDMDTVDPSDDLNSIVIAFPEQDVTFNYENASMTRSIPGITFPLGVGGLLEDLPFLPLIAPQLSLGTAYGSKLSFRYLPEMDLTPEIGKLKYLGYGIQHNPAVWLPVELPVSVAMFFFTQQLDIGKIAEASAMTYGLNASKTWGMKLLSVTPYLGFAGESSNMKFHYDYPIEFNESGIAVESIPIKFEVDGKNSARITTGLGFRVGFVNLNFDYNIAKYPSASIGTMFNFSW